MATTPSGTIISIATVFSDPVPITAITNALEASVTSIAHGFTAGDIVQISSGWGVIDNIAVRIKSATADAFVLEKLNTLNTEFFPVGSGVGTAKKATTWQQINKILNPTSSGGEPKPITVKFLASQSEISINDGFSAITESFDIDADEFGSDAYAALVALTEVQTETILKKTLRKGGLIFTPGRVSLNQNVKMADGQIMTNGVSFNGSARITRYKSAP